MNVRAGCYQRPNIVRFQAVALSEGQVSECGRTECEVSEVCDVKVLAG